MYTHTHTHTHTNTHTHTRTHTKKKKIGQEYISGKFLAKNITLFGPSAIVVHDLVKDQQNEIVSWIVEYNI